MDSHQEAVVMTALIDRLRHYESWCGETHIQKAAYILKELLEVPIPYDFILYKHGPFSFDLRYELTALRADGLVTIDPRHPHYGPRFVDTALSRNLRERFPRTMKKYQDRIEFVAKTFNKRGVAELERVSTALLVSRRVNSEGSVWERARDLVALKPHVSPDKARAAMEEMDRITEEAKILLNK